MLFRRTAAAFISAAMLVAFVGSCAAAPEVPIQDAPATLTETAETTAAETAMTETTVTASETAENAEVVQDEYPNIKFPENRTNSYGITFTEKQLIDFAKKIEADFPYIMGNILRRLPNLVKPYDESIKVGFEYINEESSIFAYSGIDFEPPIENYMDTIGAENIGGDRFYSYVLKINIYCMNDLYGEPFYGELTRGQIAHELMHTVMYNCVPYGMNGENSDSYFKFSEWFSEGTACACGFGMQEVVKSLYECGYSNDDSFMSKWLKCLWIPDPELPIAGSPEVTKYAQGYLAVMYISYIAGGGTFVDGKPADLSADIIARGLERIIYNVSIGFSLEKTFDHVSDGEYKNIVDFLKKFGDSKSVAFTKALLIESGNLSEDGELLYRILSFHGEDCISYNGEGSIILDGFDKRSGHTTAPADSTFTLDLCDPTPNVLYQLSYGGTKQVFFGGTELTKGLDRDGNKPTEFPALKTEKDAA